MPFSLLLDSSIKQLDPEDMDEIEKIEYWRQNFVACEIYSLCENVPVGFEGNFFCWGFFKVKLLNMAK